jgi:hypothetical protein
MNEPENETTTCDRFHLLKRVYESALREEALYQYGGGASIQQAIRYKSGASAESALARDRFIAHYRGCPNCMKNRDDPR